MSASVRQRLSELAWTSDITFALDGLDFALEDWGAPYEGDAYPVMKPRYMLDAYAENLGEGPFRNVLELGIRRGGSAIFFAALLRPQKLVSLDIDAGPAKLLERFRAANLLGPQLVPAYQTSQDDEAALAALLAREMDGPLDLVIDDASHEYGPSRASFEILFPRLRPGGVYVLEDWHWAHVIGGDLWPEQPALTNLVFQAQMIIPRRPDLVAKVTVVRGMAFIHKGEAAPSSRRLDLDAPAFVVRSRHYALF